jgi:pilus assembly protein CpaF
MTATMFRLGQLDRWVDDDDVTEVLVNAGHEIWIERRGGNGAQYVGRLDTATIELIIERLLAPVGRRLDRATPVVDTRLPDGSRVCAVLPPIAIDGPCLSIRKFTRHEIGLEAFGAADVMNLLGEIVRRRCNVVVSGATSSGKTTLLNALAARVASNERIITIEDTAELRIAAAHVVRLETRPATPDGVGAVVMADLVRASLRLRPDRLIIGEIRGDEAVDLVQAFNTGHDGSLVTLHANSAADALTRLASLVVRAAPSWPMRDVRDQVARSVDVVVHVARDDDGRRRVHHIVEVDPTSAERLVVLADRSGRRSELNRGRR